MNGVLMERITIIVIPASVVKKSGTWYCRDVGSSSSDCDSLSQ